MKEKKRKRDNLIEEQQEELKEEEGEEEEQQQQQQEEQQQEEVKEEEQQEEEEEQQEQQELKEEQQKEEEINRNKTCVCNVKVSFLRPNYSNLKEWMNNKNNIYIGRKGIVFIDKKRFPQENSLWFNPFKIGKDGNREEVLQKYKDYIIKRLQNNIELRNELEKLRYKNLGCWCTSKNEYYPSSNIVCHGQILMNLIHQNDDVS